MRFPFPLILSSCTKSVHPFLAEMVYKEGVFSTFTKRHSEFPLYDLDDLGFPKHIPYQHHSLHMLDIHGGDDVGVNPSDTPFHCEYTIVSLDDNRRFPRLGSGSGFAH